jgi:hypothetical protein
MANRATCLESRVVVPSRCCQADWTTSRQLDNRDQGCAPVIQLQPRVLVLDEGEATECHLEEADADFRPWYAANDILLSSIFIDTLFRSNTTVVTASLQ